MKYELDTCQVCGTKTKIVKSGNMLAKQMCSSCIADSINVESAADVRKLSMTLEIPFSLKEYYALMMSSSDKYEAMDSYLQYLSEQGTVLDEGVYDWDTIDGHYNAALSHTRALAEIQPLREAITNRGTEKWGAEYTFNHIVKLEQMYENTIRQYNITSSLQQDAIKKAAKLSVKMDDLIASNGFKELRDATAAQSQFLKTANIEDLVAASDDETIRTVADLASYLEKKGFEFSRMQPSVEQDDIDELMENYTSNVKEIVYNATGIESQFKDFIENIKKETEAQAAEDAAIGMPIAHIDDEFDVDDFLAEEENKLNLELETEQFEVDFYDEDIYQ